MGGILIIMVFLGLMWFQYKVVKPRARAEKARMMAEYQRYHGVDKDGVSGEVKQVEAVVTNTDSGGSDRE